MKKKILSSALVMGLLASGQAFANETDEITVVNPDSELYETTRLMEELELELTEDNADKLLLQDQFAEERLNESEVALENGDTDLAEEILEDYEEVVEEIETNLEEAENEDISEDVVEEVKENLHNRTVVLSALLKRENFPEQAKAAIAKALQKGKHGIKPVEEDVVPVEEDDVQVEEPTEETGEVVDQDNPVEDETTVSEDTIVSDEKEIIEDSAEKQSAVNENKGQQKKEEVKDNKEQNGKGHSTKGKGQNGQEGKGKGNKN